MREKWAAKYEIKKMFIPKKKCKFVNTYSKAKKSPLVPVIRNTVRQKTVVFGAVIRYPLQ